jgi:hypothetical protein
MPTFEDPSRETHYCRDCSAAFDPDPTHPTSPHMRVVLHHRKVHATTSVRPALSCSTTCYMRKQPGDGSDGKTTPILPYEKAYEKNDF